MARKVTIDLNGLGIDLNKGETYTIEVGEGFVSSAADNTLNDTVTENFTTDTVGPILVDTTPDLGDTESYVAIVEFVYPVRLRVNSGNFYLYKDGNPDVLVETIPYNDNRINITENKIRVNLSGILEDETTYYILTDNDIISNLIGLETGITSEDIIKWTTGIVAPEPINAVTNLTVLDNLTSSDTNFTDSRDFLGSQRNEIFNSNVISIVNDLGYDYKLTVSVSNGILAQAASAGASTITLTGSAASVSSQLTTYGYYPSNFNVSDRTCTIKLEVDDPILGYVMLENFTVDLIYTGEGTFEKTLTFETTQTWSPDEEDILYSPNYDLLVVAGGGGSSVYAGGGGGQVTNLPNRSLTLTAGQVYNIIVGQGGPAETQFTNCTSAMVGGTGGNSSAFGSSAQGGTGGYSYYCYDDNGSDTNGPITTWNVRGGDSYYNGGSYNGYDLDSGSVNYQKSAAVGFYEGPGAGAGGAPSGPDSRGPGLTAWDGNTYGIGGGDGNDDVADINYTPVKGEGGSADGYYSNSFEEAPGAPGIVKLRIRN